MTDITEISIRARTLVQLFHSLDPSPFRDKDLDPEVEAFVTEWVSELPADAPFKVVVHLPPEEAALADRARGVQVDAKIERHRAGMDPDRGAFPSLSLPPIRIRAVRAWPNISSASAIAAVGGATIAEPSAVTVWYVSVFRNLPTHRPPV